MGWQIKGKAWLRASFLVLWRYSCWPCDLQNEWRCMVCQVVTT